MSDDSPSSPEEEKRPEKGEEAAAVDREGEPDDGDDERKPISVRDLMPSAPSRRPAREREPRPSGPAEPGPEEEEDEDDGGGGQSSDEAPPSRPTPVRVAMDAPPPGDSRPAEALPSRRFEADGREWIVRITGRTITGTRPDSGALLMQLRFYDSDEPERPLRELLTVDRPLEALYPEDLREYLERSRPAAAGAQEG